MRTLLLALIVCRIFSWGSEGSDKKTSEINEWLKNKRVISTGQSSVSAGGGYGAWLQTTYLTIIAEQL
jgi:hypothetical protein